ncbi:GNAT family N-acetyltransferase [Paenibacillus pinistramenti]|uniref:GNAT family N-acetyltransferase n=1 Tax=Paenibacillus pinistramenti TaxID=1768003 RepID=UPI001EEFAAF9|nr:GNAT family N-acetyltransferase [Paenibacillus pinistramenti]
MNMVTEPENIRLEVIAWGSADYEEAVRLRDRVLRQPLGMSIYNDDLQAERQDIHLLARAGGRAAGVLLLRRIGRDTLQMKQVAVDEAMQGRGIGRRLVGFAEQTALKESARKLMLHARMTAVPFYEKLGYVKTGEPYTEVGIPHWTMFKELPGEANEH